MINGMGSFSQADSPGIFSYVNSKNRLFVDLNILLLFRSIKNNFV